MLRSLLGERPTARARIAEHRDWQKAAARARRLAEADLHRWWESGLYALQQTREQYERTGDRAALEEAATGVTALAAVVYELQSRHR